MLLTEIEEEELRRVVIMVRPDFFCWADERELLASPTDFASIDTGM
jgi:hypothetical protein